MNATVDVYGFSNKSEKLQIASRSHYDVLPPKPLLETGIAYLQKLTSEVDVVCPVLDSGWRCSDIDTMLNSTDQRVVNSIASNLQAHRVESVIDKSSMTDEQIADNAIPRSIDVSEVAAIGHYVVDNPAEPQSVEPTEPI